MNKHTTLATKSSEIDREKTISPTRKPKRSQSSRSPIDSILHLQQTIGNRAVQRMMQSGTLQAKLKIGQPGDKYEQEADRIADQVMRMPEPQVQRQSEEEEEELLQTKEVSVQTPKVTLGLESSIYALKGGSQSLPKSVRSFFEPRFGYDFSQVRVHTDTRAANLARMMNAKAFTMGRDIFFREEEYNPSRSSGRQLLAHELTHVMQQTRMDSVIIQREKISRATESEKKKEEDDGEATKVVTDSVKLLLNKLNSLNLEFKKLAIGKIEHFAERKWEELPTADKLVLGGWGAGIAGMLGAALLTDESARELFDDVNLAAPFKPIPYMPLKEFSYKKSEGEGSAGYAYQFKLGFTAEKFLEKLHEKYPEIIPIGVDIELLWGVNPGARELAIIGGTLNVSLFKGIGITAGTFTSLTPVPEHYSKPGSGDVVIQQRYPGPEAIKTPRGFQVMLSVDLMKMGWDTFSHQTREFFRRF